jgi:hypothetical protein
MRRRIIQLIAICLMGTAGLVTFGVVRDAEAQACYHYKWSVFPNCDIPCICNTCIYCPS